MNFKLIKNDDETFELTVLTNMSDMPYLIERSDDYEYLYKKKWEYEDDPKMSDNFEIYTVSVVKKYPYEAIK